MSVHATTEPSSSPSLHPSAEREPALPASDTPPAWLISQSEEALRLQLARQAQRLWAAITPQRRAKILSPLLDELTARSDTLAQLIADEVGKPVVEAQGTEVAGCMVAVRHLCGKAVRQLQPRSVSVPWQPHRSARIEYEPFGVVAVIGPWNLPLSIPFGQIAAALLAGNAVIFKPSEYAPRVGEALVSLFAVCHLPKNLLTLLQGDGRVGAALIESRPDKIFFTGSLATGKRVMAAAAQHPVPVALELGGVDALIVCEDADIELATSAAVWGATFNTGQICASVERILVHRNIRTPFVERLLSKIDQIDPARDLGRITMPRQKEVYDAQLADAKRRGLTLLRGGAYNNAGQLQPTVLEGDGIEQADIYRDETFGPVVAITTFANDAELVCKHNDSQYGLTASLFSSSLQRADAIAKQLNVGLVAINDIGAMLFAWPELPWGGRGGSGFGRSHGRDGMAEYVQSKVIDRTRRGVPEFKRPWWYPYDPSQRRLMADITQLVGRNPLGAKLRHAASAARSFVRMLADHPRL